MKSRPLFCDLFDQGILLHTMLIILCVYLVYICVSDIVCFMYYNNFRVQILWCINTNNERWGYRSKYSLHIHVYCTQTSASLSASILRCSSTNSLNLPDLKSSLSVSVTICFLARATLYKQQWVWGTMCLGLELNYHEHIINTCTCVKYDKRTHVYV